LKVAQAGAMPLIPHANTHLFYGQLSEEEFWIPGVQELLRRSDAVFLCPRWHLSQGAIAEHVLAKELGKPIFKPDDLAPNAAMGASVFGHWVHDC
jgi:hypothetical protein